MSKSKGEIGKEYQPQLTHAWGSLRSTFEIVAKTPTLTGDCKKGESPVKVCLQPQSKHQLGDLASLPLHPPAPLQSRCNKSVIVTLHLNI